MCLESDKLTGFIRLVELRVISITLKRFLLCSWWWRGPAAVLGGLPETDPHSSLCGGLVGQEPPPIG